MKFICFLFFLFSSFYSSAQTEYQDIFGDSIKKISFTCRIAYLPSAQSEFVEVNATKTRVSAKYSTYIIRKRLIKLKTQGIHFTKNDFEQLYALNSKLDQSSFDFVLSSNDKDSLKEFLNDTLYNGVPLYRLTPELLEKYLLSDTINIDKSVFAIDSLNDFLYGIVIDGAPFKFTTTRISSSNDTIIDCLKGNLYDGERYRDLGKYLKHATIYHETSLYKHLPFGRYFSRSQMLRVLLRYIEGKEGLLEFKPFEFIFEDE